MTAKYLFFFSDTKEDHQIWNEYHPFWIAYPGLIIYVRKENIRAIRCYYEQLGVKPIYEGEKVTSAGEIKFLRMQKLPTAQDHRTNRLSRRRLDYGFTQGPCRLECL